VAVWVGAVHTAAPAQRTVIASRVRAMPRAGAETSEVETKRSQRAQALLQALARRIRQSRDRLGMTQEAFAQRCGISVSFASLLERGERSPSYETLVEVAEALETSLAELLRETGPSDEDAHTLRLLDFARRYKLNAEQVDRLLAVAGAMFDPPGTQALRALPGSRGDGVTCTEAGCARAVLARGLCASHYHRARRAGQ
jgi:transcriptional regulator with XRE-family HTH domain